MNLLDSNILYALYLDNDRLHLEAKKEILSLVKQKNCKLLIHPLVLIEVLSLVKYRNGIEKVRMIMSELDDVKKYFKIDEPIILDAKVYKIFEKYPKIGLIDASLINYCLKNRINLVTFDEEMKKVWRELDCRL